MNMQIDKIKELSEKGENEYDLNSDEDLLSVPSANHKTGMEFRLEDVLECFNKPAHLRDMVFLVGGTVIRGKGNDVDIVIRGDDFSEEIKESLNFRLYRAFADYFNIEYDLVSEYLHISYSGAGGSFTDFVSMYNFSIVPTKDDERAIRKMSLDEENDDEKFEVLSKSKDFIIGGIVSDTSEDLEQERITPKALKQIWESIKKTPQEFRGLFDSHNSTCIGSLIMDYKKYRCALIDNSKLYLIFKLRNDMPIAQKIIKTIVSGELKSFSIKFGIKDPKKNIKTICDEENQCVTEILGGTYYLETSLTPNPANKNTTLEILSKEKK